MRDLIKIVLLFALFNAVVLTSLADRGVGKKKAKISLNIASNVPLSKSLSFNMRSGLRYTGSLLSTVETSRGSILYNSLVTYQKGNTIFIIPFKQKVVVPEMKQGYTGMKLIIKPKL